MFAAIKDKGVNWGKMVPGHRLPRSPVPYQSRSYATDIEGKVPNWLVNAGLLSFYR